MKLKPRWSRPRVPYPVSIRRWSLWGVLVLLVVSMLALLVWLAGTYEAAQVQSCLLYTSPSPRD